MKVHLGVKSDPIESRYTFDWLFGIMKDCGVDRLQYGSSLSTFAADDEHFRALRAKAEKKGIRIASLFTSHREIGGFSSGDPSLEAVTLRQWERIMHVASLLGADSAGSNANLTPRDRPEMKDTGIRRFLEAARDLMKQARRKGLKALTIEPMSSLWEFPSTPEEILLMTGELDGFHAANPGTTVPVYLCSDISHGVADENRRVVHDNWSLFEMQVPWMWEFHFKNTDEIFNATFGFSPEETARGIVDLARLAALIQRNAGRFPTAELTGYLEISGPKVGRDYADVHLERMLVESLTAIRRHFG